MNYAQENALMGMTFASLHVQNVHLRHWESTVADTRIHGTTRQQVQQHLETVERSALLPLPESRSPNYREGQRKVHRDGHVEVQKSFYLVPPEYLGYTVWVRYDERMVRASCDSAEVVRPEDDPKSTHVRLQLESAFGGTGADDDQSTLGW